MTAITLALYTCATILAGTVMIVLGITRTPIAWLDNLSFALVASIFPGFLVAFAWAKGRATSDQPQSWWLSSRTGRAEEFPLYFFGKAMPKPLKAMALVLLAAVAATALITFIVASVSVDAAPLASRIAASMCGHRFSNHGTVVCLSEAQGAAAQATFPVVALGFYLVICTICASGLLEQRSLLMSWRDDTPQPTAP